MQAEETATTTGVLLTPSDRAYLHSRKSEWAKWAKAHGIPTHGNSLSTFIRWAAFNAPIPSKEATNTQPIQETQTAQPA